PGAPGRGDRPRRQHRRRPGLPHPLRVPPRQRRRHQPLPTALRRLLTLHRRAWAGAPPGGGEAPEAPAPAHGRAWGRGPMLRRRTGLGPRPGRRSRQKQRRQRPALPTPYAGQYFDERWVNFQPPTPRAKAPTPNTVPKRIRRLWWATGSVLSTATASPWGAPPGGAAVGAVVAVGKAGMGGRTSSSGGGTPGAGGASFESFPSFSSFFGAGAGAGPGSGAGAAADRGAGAGLVAGGGPTQGRPVPAAVSPLPLPGPGRAGGGDEPDWDVGGGAGGGGAGPGSFPGGGAGELPGGDEADGGDVVVVSPPFTSILPHMPWNVLPSLSTLPWCLQ